MGSNSTVGTDNTPKSNLNNNNNNNNNSNMAGIRSGSINSSVNFAQTPIFTAKDTIGTIEFIDSEFELTSDHTHVSTTHTLTHTHTGSINTQTNTQIDTMYTETHITSTYAVDSDSDNDNDNDSVNVEYGRRKDINEYFETFLKTNPFWTILYFIVCNNKFCKLFCIFYIYYKYSIIK